mmetsp:Transcript_3868/g.14001  ORF Transcript_3868/g.14001 Transcript_3868/m.14001 type:complete len:109 (+) Transcript_3868:230-556(+)
MPSNGWFSRAFRSATGRSSKATTTGANGSPTGAVVPDVDALTREFELRARAATSSGRNIPSATGEGSGATVSGAATMSTGGVGSDGTRKMCVEDFEPLKIIGRGAFGA